MKVLLRFLKRTLGILTGMLLVEAAQAMPPWAKLGEKLDGSTYTVVCTGDGPALDLARAQALQGCQASASRHLAQTVKVRSLSIGTEADVGYHEEVESSVQVKNLKCQPEHEGVEEADDHFRVWLQCKFNLDSASTTEIPATKPPESASLETSGIANRDDLAKIKEAGPMPAAQAPGRHSERTSLSISSVPACADLLVRGDRPRRIRCDHNPMMISLERGDTSIIVRAPEHQPKTIELRGRRPANDSVLLVLDPL